MKVALVTGGARGIGAAIVKRLAQDGAAVAFTYVLRPTRPTTLPPPSTPAAAGAAIRADSADAAAVRAAVAQTVEHFGGLDILVTNASILNLAPIEDYPLEDFDRMVATNVRGVFVAVQAAAKVMKEGGRIVTIGSIAGMRVAFQTSSVYSMTKGAVAALVRGAAIDLAPRGITVNNVQPGPTETDMNPADGPHAAALQTMIPARRFGKPEEVAGMVAYLASGEAGFVTGASFTGDGGL
jgi:3-oxoacyl-[acyl-carrier protein] reductase